jgi:hypothetical protein
MPHDYETAMEVRWIIDLITYFEKPFCLSDVVDMRYDPFNYDGYCAGNPEMDTPEWLEVVRMWDTI